MMQTFEKRFYTYYCSACDHIYTLDSDLVPTVCGICGGAIEVRTVEQQVPCEVCNGNGEVWLPAPNRDPQDEVLGSCPECEGKGYIYQEVS